MNLMLVRILWSICSILWIWTYFGTKLFPSLASFPLTHWLPMVNMILLPIGLALSSYVLLSSPDNRRKAGWFTLGFAGLYAVMLGMLLTSAFLTHRLITLPEVDPLPPLLRKLYTGDSPSDPRTLAQAVYTVSGVEVPYRKADNAYEMYLAPEQQKTKWEEYKKDQAEIDHGLSMLNAGLQRAFTLIAISLSSLLLSIAAGTVMLMMGRSKDLSTEPAQVDS